MNILSSVKSNTFNKNKLPQPINDFTFRLKSTTTVVPTTANGYTVTNNNTTTMVNDGTRGYVFNFSGTNSLSINLATPLNSTKTFWLSSSTPGYNSGNVFSTTKMPMWFNGTTLLRATVNFSPGINVTSNVAQTSTWRFYAITTTPTTTSLYINGALVVTASVTWTGDADKMMFGAYQINNNNYTGLMDDIRFYSNILTSTDIMSLYTTTL